MMYLFYVTLNSVPFITIISYLHELLPIHDCNLSLRFFNRPTSSTADTTQSRNEVDTSGPVKLDAAAQAHIEKHR